MTEDTLEPKKKDEPAATELESSLTLQALMVFLLAVFTGLVIAALVLPIWLPGFADSFTGTSPKAYWYLSRGTGFVALGLLWVSMMLGVGITNKMAKIWPGIPPSFAIHEYVSLLGVFFVGFHALILLGDKYSKYQVAQLLMPFGSTQYRPTWVGLGQLAFYAWLIIALTFYIRKLIGQKTWRAIHFFSFLTYLAALVHGLTSGTDVGTVWAKNFYWITGGSFLFLLVYRILTSRKEKRAPAPVRKPAQPAAQPTVQPANASAAPRPSVEKQEQP
jgi:predicted ferric reductase